MNRYLTRLLGRNGTRTESGRQVRKRHPVKLFRRQPGLEALEDRCLLNAAPEQIGLVNCDSSKPYDGTNASACRPECHLKIEGLQFFPNKPGTDVIEGDGNTLVLQPGTPLSNVASSSNSIPKRVTVWVTGWDTKTATPVEVLILNPGGGRILLGSGIGNNLPNDLDVDPGERTVPDVVNSDAPGNMHNPGVTDPFFKPINDQETYPFGLGFSAGPAAATLQTLIRVRQGACQVDTPLRLLVPPATTQGVATAPTSPGALQGMATSTTTAELSWDNSAGAGGYYVYQWNGSEWQKIGTVAANVTKVSLTGLQPGTTNYFYVEAYNSVGRTGTSNYVTVTTQDSGAVDDALARDPFAGSGFDDYWDDYWG